MAEALREAIGAPIPTAQRAEHASRAIAACEQLRAVAFERAWRRGRAVPLEEAVTMAIAMAMSQGQA